MIAKELLPQIAPWVSNKYSHNLHAWINRHLSKSHEHIVVSNANGFGLRLIGKKDDEGWFYGTTLNSVLCNGASPNTWAFAPSDYLVRRGIDQEFWHRYIATGRCAIDTYHDRSFIGDEDRYRLHNGGLVRVCQWCGNVQVKLSWNETVTHSEWVPA